MLPYEKLLAQLGPPSPLEAIGLVTPGQMDGQAKPGVCIGYGGHDADRTWIVPFNASRYCSLHLRELLRRIAWWPEPLPPN